jgi:hypothetical protein
MCTIDNFSFCCNFFALDPEPKRQIFARDKLHETDIPSDFRNQRKIQQQKEKRYNLYFDGTTVIPTRLSSTTGQSSSCVWKSEKHGENASGDKIRATGPGPFAQTHKLNRNCRENLL